MRSDKIRLSLSHIGGEERRKNGMRWEVEVTEEKGTVRRR